MRSSGGSSLPSVRVNDATQQGLEGGLRALLRTPRPPGTNNSGTPTARLLGVCEGLVSVHTEPQPDGCRGGVRGSPGLGPPRYRLSARKMWMVRGYGVAASCGPGDVCDRGCRVFEVERVNHMHGREGAPRWWRGCPENTRRRRHGGAVERHGEGKLTAPSAAAGRPGGVCDVFFRWDGSTRCMGGMGRCGGSACGPKKSARPVRFWSRVAPGGGGAASWEIPPPRVATG